MQIDATVREAINQMREVHFIALSRLEPLFPSTSKDTPDMKLMESMMFGFRNPVLIDEERRIIAGHSRVLAAQELGMTEAPCITLSNLSFEQKRACALADLYMKHPSEWDEEKLRKVLENHAMDIACYALVWPYAEARKNLVSWLGQLDQLGRVQALENIKSDNRWNGDTLTSGLDAVLAVRDYRSGVDNLYYLKDIGDSEYEEQYGEMDEDEPVNRPDTPDEIAAELELEKTADTAGRLLVKISFEHRDSIIKEGLLDVAYAEAYTKRLNRALQRWQGKA